MASERSKRKDIAQEVTDRIIERIEESGGELPWRKPWRSRAIAHPCRHEGIGYRGINHLILSLEAFARGFSSPYWMTFRQSKEYGGSVINAVGGRLQHQSRATMPSEWKGATGLDSHNGVARH